MEARVPFEVVYDTRETLSVFEIARSLLAVERAGREIPLIFERSIDGLTVETLSVSLSELEHASPLRELFVFSLVVAFQDDLEVEVGNLYERLFGHSIPDTYDTALTIAVLVALFYGADFAYRRMVADKPAVHLRAELEKQIKEFSERIGVDEDKVREVLDDVFGRRRLRALARSAIDFFNPAKRREGSTIRVDQKTLNPDAVSEVPSVIDAETFEPPETSDPYQGVEIELHAHDKDKAESGWAGAIPELDIKRVRMSLYPPLDPEQIFTRDKVRGDIILVSRRQDDGEYEPYMFHLVRMTE
jgi:hypothetical protein